MEELNKNIFHCSGCKKSYSKKTPKDIQVNRSIVDLIFDNKIFDSTCPYCGLVETQPYDVNFISGHFKYLIRYTCHNPYLLADEYHKVNPEFKVRIVDDLASLQEKIICFTYNLDDRVVAFIEYALFDELAEIIKPHLIGVDDKFLVFQYQKKFKSVNISEYQQATKILEEKYHYSNFDDLVVDENWVKLVVDDLAE